MDEGKWELLRKEVEAFRYHPALLSWYTADEPGFGVDPAHLEKIYQFIRKLDPYHPVTVVFCNIRQVPRGKSHGPPARRPRRRPQPGSGHADHIWCRTGDANVPATGNNRNGKMRLRCALRSSRQAARGFDAG